MGRSDACRLDAYDILGGYKSPRIKRRTRLCGTKWRASNAAMSHEYPSPLSSSMVLSRSRPPLEVANPVTFSSITTLGRRFPNSFRIRRNSPSELDSRPLRPARFPARERSVQGKEAVAMSASGTSVPVRRAMSSRTKSLSPKFSAYMSALTAEMSEVDPENWTVG